MFLSANPFVAGCPGAINFWNIPASLQNSSNSSLVNIVALSDTMTSGNPWCAKTSLSNSMVEEDVGADTHGLISAHLDFASMITRK